MGRAGEVAGQAVERNGTDSEAAMEGAGGPAVARGDVEYGFKREESGKFGMKNAFAAEPGVDEFEFGEDGEGGLVRRVVEELWFKDAGHSFRVTVGRG